MKLFGDILRGKREALGYSQKWLSIKLGVSNYTISKWERGEAYPDILEACDLADIFGCTLDELVGRTKAK